MSVKSSKAISAFAALLLGLIFFQAFFASRNFSVATDEVTHLPSGYSYLRTGKITLNPQHPPLVKMLAAVPVLFLHPKFDASDPNLAGPEPNEWEFGNRFLFENDANRMIFWARIPPILISVLLGLYLFKWASELFNPVAGILALSQYAFMPTVLAHSQFVTTDVPVAAFSFIALYYFWKLLAAGNHFIPGGIFLGLALGTKFSAVFLLPILFVLYLRYWLDSRNTSTTPKLRRSTNTMPKGASGVSLTKLVFVFGIAFLTLWAIYLFPPDLLFYKKAMDTLYADKDPSHLYYLNGQFKAGGWWYYFLWAFVIKTPIPSFLLFAAGLIASRQYPVSRLDKVFLLLPIAVFTAATSLSAHDIGVRYMIPVYPFMILYASGLAAVRWGERFQRYAYGAMVVLVLWQVVSAFTIYPNYLAYFNELVGGPANGPKYLDDSNIEWGQDLKRLAAYQKTHPELKVAYPWQHIDVAYYGVKNNLMDVEGKWWAHPSGMYALSAHFLVRTKLVSRMLNDPDLDWFSRYRPVDRIGYSFYIYEFN